MPRNATYIIPDAQNLLESVPNSALRWPGVKSHNPGGGGAKFGERAPKGPSQGRDPVPFWVKASGLGVQAGPAVQPGVGMVLGLWTSAHPRPPDYRPPARSPPASTCTMWPSGLGALGSSTSIRVGRRTKRKRAQSHVECTCAMGWNKG
jgi:hypothetical protein